MNGLAETSPHGQAAETLLALARRLRAVLEEETAALRGHDLSRLEEHARQKDKLMLDISRLPRMAAAEGVARGELEALGEALARNAAALKLHMDATAEFAEFVEDTIRRRQTDGTYSRRRAAGYGKW